MKKLYLFLILACSLESIAQINANNDNAFNANAYMGGTLGQANYYTYMNVLSNDQLNGSSVWQLVTLTQLSTTHPGVTISPNGLLSINPTTPAGTYTVNYQICENANPTNCDTATLTVQVCSLPVPTLTYTDADCNTPTGTITLNGLPSGNWTILKKQDWNGVWQPTTGTGSSYTFTGLNDNYFSFQVLSDNCTSPVVSQSISHPYGFDVQFDGTYVDQNADGAVNVGDIVNYNIGMVNTLDCAITNLDIVYSSLNTVGSVSSVSANSIAYSLTATYVLTQADINAGEVYQSMWVGGDSAAGSQYTKASGSYALALSDGIKMHAFFDLDGDGVQDLGENDCTLGNFYYEINNDGVEHSLYTNQSELTLYESNPVNSYDIGYTITNVYCGAQYVIGSAFTNVTVADGSGITVYNFPIQIVPCSDVGVYISESYGWPRPGFPYGNRIMYKNFGNTTLSGMITFTKPALTTIDSVSETVTNTANGFTFNYTNLLPGEIRYIDILFAALPATSVVIGDVLTANVSITGDTSDLTNNSFTINQDVVASWDPNDKSESHGGKIVHASFTSNHYLTYTIRFENTGNANAITVKLLDELDQKLDESSLRMIDASHDYVLDRTGDLLTWKFNGIDLPPSVDGTDTGKGYVVFQIKPKAGYAVGDIILNNANIYFDFNPAISTNMVETEFVNFLAVDQFATDGFAVYPNPANNLLNISAKSKIQKVEVIDVLGKNVLIKTANDSLMQLDLSGLSNGMYFVKVQAATGHKTLKIIKK